LDIPAASGNARRRVPRNPATGFVLNKVMFRSCQGLRRWRQWVVTAALTATRSSAALPEPLHPVCACLRAPANTGGRLARTYGSGGIRCSRSVRKYTDRLISARVAAAMAPAHQYQPPSVTAATIKPAASTASVMASPSRHHRGSPELTLSAYLAKDHKIRRGMEGWHRRSSYLTPTTPRAPRPDMCQGESTRLSDQLSDYGLPCR
jgi:hypothetical protein